MLVDVLSHVLALVTVASTSRTYDTNRTLIEHYVEHGSARDDTNATRSFLAKLKDFCRCSQTPSHQIYAGFVPSLSSPKQAMTNCSLALCSLTKSRARYQKLLIQIVF